MYETKRGEQKQFHFLGSVDSSIKAKPHSLTNSVSVVTQAGTKIKISEQKMFQPGRKVFMWLSYTSQILKLSMAVELAGSLPRPDGQTAAIPILEQRSRVQQPTEKCRDSTLT